MNETDYTPEGLAATYASTERTAIGGYFGGRMQRRLRVAFLKGYRDEPRPVEQSNYDKPVSRAYRAGKVAKARAIPIAIVRCVACGHEQADMGNGVACEECGELLPST